MKVFKVTNLFLILLFFPTTFICFGQNYSDSFPLLIRIKKLPEPLKIEIPLECIKDSLKAGIQVMVSFDNEICDTTKTLNPVEIYIGFIFYYKEVSERILLSRLDSIDNPHDRCIWEACSEKFLEWMQNQPYDKLYERENILEGVKKTSFFISFRLVPSSAKFRSTERLCLSRNIKANQQTK